MAFSKLDGKGIDLSSNVLTSFASTGIDDNATSTALTIASNGNATFGGEVDAGESRFLQPSTFWSGSTAFFGHNYGSLATQGNYDLHLTANGYRNSSGTWTSLAVNSKTGAAQIALDPDGEIGFNTDATKANGDSHTVTRRMTINADGDLGIGNTNPDARLSVGTDQQLIARFASTNTGITGLRIEGIDASASNDTVYVDWFYDAENRQYGFGEGTSSGSLPINSGIAQADIIISDGNLKLTSGRLELSNGGKLQVSASVPQNTDLTGGSSNGTDSDGLFSFYGGLSYNTGAGIVLNGADHATNPNLIRFMNGAWVERFRINENGTQKATFNDTLLKESTSYVHYDVNVATTDTQWTGADYTKSAIFIDMDASGSGGDTADELRLYGIRSDLRSTHQTADLLTGVYGYVESQHSTGITSNLYGVYGYAVADDTGTGRTSNCIGVQGLSYGYGTGTGGVTTYYGGYFKTLLSTYADKDTTNAFGTRSEVEIDNPGQAQTLTNAYVVASEFDNDSASNVTITNSYLYYGNYAGTLPTNAYGLYILDGVQNYLAGSFSVGGTKNFRIKHPLPALAETHDLVHTVIESPSADNIYSGMINLVDGSATVNIDTIAGMTEGTFVALNRSIRRFVSNEEGFTAVKSSIAGNILTITAQDNTCTDEVFWMVIGQRQDAEIKATPGTDADGYLIVEPEHVEHVRPEKGEIYDERDIGSDTVEE